MAGWKMVDRRVPGVTSAQVKAAQRLVKAAESSDQPVSDALRTIATAMPDASGPDQLTLDVGHADFHDQGLIGYGGPTACAVAGVTYRQLDYWARTDLVVPSIRAESEAGTVRLYSFTDLLLLKVIKRLLDTGVSLQNVRTVIDHLRGRGVDDIAQVTLLSDGETIYEATSSEEIVDLLQNGQAVFGIAISGALREVTGSVAVLPGVHGEQDDSVPEKSPPPVRRNNVG
jgi:DNA-binding transcriptional MerR regulator